jgi:hypothetical protein
LLSLPFLAMALKSRRDAHQQRLPIWMCGSRYSPQITRTTTAMFGFLYRDSLSALWAVAQRRIGRPSRKLLVSPLPAFFALSPGRGAIDPIAFVYNLAVFFLQRVSTFVGGLIQNGNLRNYVLYIFMLIVLVLAALTLWGGR